MKCAFLCAKYLINKEIIAIPEVLYSTVLHKEVAVTEIENYWLQ